MMVYFNMLILIYGKDNACIIKIFCLKSARLKYYKHITKILL